MNAHIFSSAQCYQKSAIKGKVAFTHHLAIEAQGPIADVSLFSDANVNHIKVLLSVD